MELFTTMRGAPLGHRGRWSAIGIAASAGSGLERLGPVITLRAANELDIYTTFVIPAKAGGALQQRSWSSSALG